MKRTFLAALAAITLTAACVKPVQTSQLGPSALAADLDTYAIVDHPVGSSLSTNHVFLTHVHEAMQRKGYARVAKADAALLLSFKALVTGEGSEERSGLGTDLLLATGDSATGEDVRKVVLVLVEEAATDRILWLGWSSADYPKDEVVRRTDEAVQKILAQLPASR